MISRRSDRSNSGTLRPLPGNSARRSKAADSRAVYGIVTDELGVQYIVRHRLAKWRQLEPRARTGTDTSGGPIEWRGYPDGRNSAARRTDKPGIRVEFIACPVIRESRRAHEAREVAGSGAARTSHVLAVVVAGVSCRKGLAGVGAPAVRKALPRTGAGKDVRARSASAVQARAGRFAASRTPTTTEVPWFEFRRPSADPRVDPPRTLD
jgi:hypothetical protein